MKRTNYRRTSIITFTPVWLHESPLNSYKNIMQLPFSLHTARVIRQIDTPPEGTVGYRRPCGLSKGHTARTYGHDCRIRHCWPWHILLLHRLIVSHAVTAGRLSAHFWRTGHKSCALAGSGSHSTSRHNLLRVAYYSDQYSTVRPLFVKIALICKNQVKARVRVRIRVSVSSPCR